MFRFVGNNAEGLPLKRKQTQRACDDCRKRKRRCQHLNGSNNNNDSNTPSTRVNGGSETVIRPQSARRLIASPVASPRNTISNNVVNHVSPTIQPSSDLAVITRNEPSWNDDQVEDHPSFIGDLNPEGAFLADRSPSEAGPASDSAGIWLQRQTLRGRRDSSLQSLDAISGGGNLLSKLVFSHLKDDCLRQIPSKDDYQVLRSIYLEHVYSLYPVLEQSSVPLPEDDSPAQTILKQAICLAASTTPFAKLHLKLPLEHGGHKLYSPKEFRRQMTRSIRTSIYLGLVRSRVYMLQIYSMLSFFTQLADDRHSSAQDAASAVSYLHTIGLHLETQEKRTDHDFVTRLFCCTWLLDRLNAAFHGRPILMHERDFGRNLEECFSKQEPTFQLLLRVTILLDRVIALYRPTINEASTGWDEGFPAFEELINQSGAFGVRSNLLATIETLYHAVAMLTCRSKSMTKVVRSSASFARQMLSANAVTHIVAAEYRGQLTLLPMVPYAVCLALRCAYRELRLSKSTYNRERAKRQLVTNCDILRELAETFPAAMLMVELAEQTLQEMEKVVSTILNTQSSNIQGTADESRDSNSQQDSGTMQISGSSANHVHTMPPQPTEALHFGTDFDVFDYFDPDFNLDAIDAMLGDNIELSFPYTQSSPEN